MARTAIDSAGMNVHIDATLLEDKRLARRCVDEWQSIQTQAASRIEQILNEVDKRGISINR